MILLPMGKMYPMGRSESIGFRPGMIAKFSRHLREAGPQGWEKSVEKKQSQQDADPIEKKIRYRTIPRGNKGLMKFIQRTDDQGDKSGGNHPALGGLSSPRTKR